MPKITRKGSGRTKGSFSFVKISLADLNAKFSDPSQPITVGRKFAEACGFAGLSSGPANAINDSIQGQTPATRVGVVVSDLND